MPFYFILVTFNVNAINVIKRFCKCVSHVNSVRGASVLFWLWMEIWVCGFAALVQTEINKFYCGDPPLVPKKGSHL